MAEIVKKRPSQTSSERDKAVPSAPKKLDAARTAAHADTWPAEGPHARRELINEDATPGAGLFSTKSAGDKDVDPGAG